MTIQVNSDHTIGIDARLTSFVEDEVQRRLGRFVTTLTRVEIHLSDVDKKKSGKADKRCLVEVRPAGGRPVTTSATATKLAAAVGSALGKMQRSLTTVFGREGRTARPVAPADATAPARSVAARKTAATKTAAKKTAAKKTAAKKTAAEKTAAKKTTAKAPAAKKQAAATEAAASTTTAGGPKKKRIYQARRKAWPAR